MMGFSPGGGGGWSPSNIGTNMGNMMGGGGGGFGPSVSNAPGNYMNMTGAPGGGDFNPYMS